MARKDPANWLSDYFPYFSEELALILTRKLNQVEIKQLKSELQETADDLEQRLYKRLATMKQQEMVACIRQRAEASADDKKPSLVNTHCS